MNTENKTENNADQPGDQSTDAASPPADAPIKTPTDAAAATPVEATTDAPIAPASENANADSPAAPVDKDALNNPEGTTLEQLREQALEATKNVFDPEIPVNIYELGLIYDVIIDEKRDAKVIMTLTSPACPAAQELPMEVQGRIAVILGINDVEVDVVFDPPWSPDKMSEAAKVQLGFDL